MKAFEAIAILEALDPSHEVTLTINTNKCTKSFEPIPTKSTQTTIWDDYTREWVLGKQFWPNQNHYDSISTSTIH